MLISRVTAGIIVAIGFIAVIFAPLGGAAQERSRCPVVRTQGPFAPDELIRAVRAQLPKIYSDLTDMGKKVPINTRTYDIVALVKLGIAPAPAYLKGFRQIGLRICPARVVNASWAVLIELTAVQLPASQRTLLFARAREGWVAWYHN